MTRLSFIIPTLGRTTLAFPLTHLTMNARPEDEVLVAVDEGGEVGLAHKIVNDTRAGMPCPIQAFNVKPSPWGNGGRDAAIERATGDRLVFMDDDDTWLGGGIDAIRSAAAQHPDRPLMFKMRMWVIEEGVWVKPVLEPGNVGTPMFVPLNRKPLPRWIESEDRISDYYWIKRVVEQQGEPVWIDRMICQVDPTRAQFAAMLDKQQAERKARRKAR